MQHHRKQAVYTYVDANTADCTPDGRMRDSRVSRQALCNWDGFVTSFRAIIYKGRCPMCLLPKRRSGIIVQIFLLSMAVSTASLFASITSIAGWWGTVVQGSNGVELGNSDAILHVPARVRNVYPAENFNRDVTTSWWETKVLDGHSTIESSSFSKAMRDATFLVLDQGMYEVSPLTHERLKKSC